MPAGVRRSEQVRANAKHGSARPLALARYLGRTAVARPRGHASRHIAGDKTVDEKNAFFCRPHEAFRGSRVGDGCDVNEA